MRPLLLLLMTALTALSAPERLPLWPSGAPAALGQTDRDQPRLEYYPAPKAQANGAAVVVCPGGGYGGLADDHEGVQPALYYNSIGVTAYVLYYRLGPHGYHHPVQLNDAKRALRLARSRAAQDGVDPARIGIMGFSAGGHLAATAGTQFDAGDPAAADAVDRVSSRPDFMVLCYPVASFDPAITHRGSVNNLLGERAGDAALLKALSSENNVTAQTPPAFLFHTTEDKAVPVENSLRLYESLKRAGIPAELHAYQNGPHGVGLMHGDPVLGTWPGHLTAWLRANGLLAGKFERAAVSGMITMNGQPVNRATICFTPQDPDLPVVTARLKDGKFELDAASGPPCGEADISITFSAQYAPGVPAPGGFLTATEKAQGKGAKLTAKLAAGTANALTLDLTWVAP